MTKSEIRIFIAKLVILGIERYCENAIITKDIVFYFSDEGMHKEGFHAEKYTYKYLDYNEAELLEVILKCQATS